MSFVAIDFETANPCRSSICQIGIAMFDEAGNATTWDTLVNPRDYFDINNTRIHGINESHVINAPLFPDIYSKVIEICDKQIVVHHTSFDRIALTRVLDKYNLPAFECEWLDSSIVVRNTWPELRERGYGLPDVARMLNINFQHHTAKEDARAAGVIVLRAIEVSGIGLKEWLSQSITPTGSAKSRDYSQKKCKQPGNPDGYLAGEIVVFTGSMKIPRPEAAMLAANAGCDVEDGVTKKTTILVVGDQDIRLLAGHEKSSKHRKAEDLIGKGQAIRILGESDFMLLIGGMERRKSQHRLKLGLRYDWYAQIFGLGKLAASFFASNQVIGLLGDAAADLATEILDECFDFRTTVLRKRSGNDKGFACQPARWCNGPLLFSEFNS